jgi:oligopeptidase A
MTTSPIPAAPEHESLEPLRDSLAGMLRRLKELISQPELDADAVVEITSIYNNVAYVFLYLEANEEHVQYDSLLPWRDAFHRDDKLDACILHLLQRVTFEDPDVESARTAYVAQLVSKRDTRLGGAAQIDSLLTRAKEVLAGEQAAQSALIARITRSDPPPNPATAFYRLQSTTTAAETRSKLWRVWQAQSADQAPPLIDLIDQMIVARRASSTARGHRSVLSDTLRKCRVDEDVVADFSRRYLTRAIHGHQILSAEIAAALGTDDQPMAHFPYYLRHVSAGADRPLFALGPCLDFIFEVAGRIFDLTLTGESDPEAPVIEVAVRRGGKQIGQVNCDLWDTGGKPVGANYTKGLRNRTDWGNHFQMPIAYVSCRFRRVSGIQRITFQNVHSLFHEFGHALNHVLIRKRISNQSGLEYLPLERLEIMSMWFEKWVYHTDFASKVAEENIDPKTIRLCQRLKALEYRRTYAERAAASILDFDVHRRHSGGLAESFRDLDADYGLSRVCGLHDLARYFTWPMYQANPGANFVYLWGAAASVEAFTRFEDMPLHGVLPGDGNSSVFAGCLDYDLPSPAPDPGSVFEFYDRLAAPVPAARPA